MDNNTVFDVLNIAIRSIVSVSVLFILTRIMGKKQISQLTYFDYVVGITIGSVAAELALEKNVHYPEGIISMLMLTLFPIVLSFISVKSNIARKIFDGTPKILVQNGKIVEKNLKNTQITVNDLLEELRINKVFNLGDVEFVILETSGRFSIQLKSNMQFTTPSDLNISTTYKGLCTNLIIDGKLVKDNLIYINKNNIWLINELQKQNISSIDEVLLAFLDTNNILHVDKKNSDPIIQNSLG
jgi:uncharacterized membrane protein YcaP (DUF421 family)